MGTTSGQYFAVCFSMLCCGIWLVISCVLKTGTHPHTYMYAGPELCPHLHYLHYMMYILLALLCRMLPSHLMGDSLTGDRSLGGERAWNSHATLICPYLANSDHQTTLAGLSPI